MLSFKPSREEKCCSFGFQGIISHARAEDNYPGKLGHMGELVTP
jgi:hypothetical protein